MIVKRLEEMGIVMNDPPAPVAAYIPAVRTGCYICTSGQIPLVGGVLKYKGKVGAELSEQQGYEAARVCAVNCLYAIKGVVDDLNLIQRVVRITGYVNSAPGFTAQPNVINGASEFLSGVFGENGKHVRSAVGVCELPMDAPVILEMVVELKQGKEH